MSLHDITAYHVIQVPVGGARSVRVGLCGGRGSAEEERAVGRDDEL